jgi:hypothetical protein
VCAGSTLLLAKQSLDEAPYKLSRAVKKLATITFGHLSALLLIDIPWFLNGGKILLLYSPHLPLGIPNGLVIQLGTNSFLAPSTSNQALFWRRCRGRSGRPLQEDFFAHTSFTLLFVLLYFTLFLLVSFYIKNPKKIESLIVVFTYLLLVLLKWLILKILSYVILLA